MRSVTAYVYAGQWVARCVRDGCSSAEFHGQAANGHIGGLTDSAFHCSACGLVTAVDWPTERETIERILAARPAPDTRNWLPQETLDDLMRENVAHGLVSAADIHRG